MNSRRFLKVAGVTLLAVLLLAVVAAFVYFSPHSPYRHGKYTPGNVDQAHTYLLKHLPPETIEEIKQFSSEDEMIKYHFGIGLWMRNEWGLWSGSRLSRYFNRFGVAHPDDMSGIILDTFWCRVHGQPLRLEERLSQARAWEVAAAFPENCVTPTDGAKIDFRQSCSRGTKEKPRIIYIGKSTSDGSQWVWEHGKGVYPMNAEIQAIFDEPPKKQNP